jgi:hypothetical protein
MATNRYNNDISQLRQQAVFSQPNQQNMTKGVMDFMDLIDRSNMRPGSDQDAFKNYDYSHDIDHSGDSWKPADANPPGGNFGPITTKPNDTNKGGVTSTRIEDLVKMTNQVYTPQTRAGDRYNDLLDNMPERNKPGLLRALTAGATAFGANAKGMDIQNISDRVMYSPYIRDMAEWKEKTGPYQQAAQLENTSNANERQLAGNLVNNWTTGERNAETARYNDDRNRIAESRAQSERIRAQAYALKQQQWTIKFDGDRMIGFNPQNPGVPVDLGPSSGMDERDKLILMGTNQMNVVNANNTAAAARTDANNVAAQARVETAGKNAVTTKQTVPGANPATAKPPAQLSPTQQKQEMINRQQQVYNENPKWQEFFDLNPDNTVSLIPPIDEGWGIPNFMGMGSNSKEKVIEYWKAYKAINPTAQIPQQYDSDYQAGGSKEYKYERDPVNPEMRWRRTRDGVNFEITHDGGKTWTVSRDR